MDGDIYSSVINLYSYCIQLLYVVWRAGTKLILISHDFIVRLSPYICISKSFMTKRDETEKHPHNKFVAYIINVKSDRNVLIEYAVCSNTAEH